MNVPSVPFGYCSFFPNRVARLFPFKSVVSQLVNSVPVWQMKRLHNSNWSAIVSLLNVRSVVGSFLHKRFLFLQLGSFQCKYLYGDGFMMPCMIYMLYVVF